MDTTLTTRAQEVIAEQNAPTPTAVQEAEKVRTEAAKKLHADFRSRIAATKTYKRKLIPNWTESIDRRRGKTAASEGDESKIAINMDWGLTKTKQSSLFSQVPKARLSHFPNSATAEPWLTALETKVNDTLLVAGIEAAMYEVLPDVINATGIGFAMASYESITVDKKVPAMDLSQFPPEIADQVRQTGMLKGQPVEMTVVPQKVDSRYVIQRISTSDALWALEFIGSDLNKSPWIGHTGRILWPEAMSKFGLKEVDKSKYIGGDDKNSLDRLTHDTDKDKPQGDEVVEYDEIFYKVHAFTEGATSYNALHHLVFVNGQEEPVIDEPWKGQRMVPGPDGNPTIIGVLRYPIQALTLAYLTDETIPPSDSAISRSQVDELNKSRIQRNKQRDRSIPVRWGDVNRLDPAVMQTLMRGGWQHFIPVQGDGTRVIGEVARAAYPPDNNNFDEMAKTEIAEQWNVGPNQLGSGAGVETRGESDEIASNFQTRIGQDRARVGAFVVALAEIIGGFLCLYEDPASFGEGFDPAFSKSLQFSILADSTVLLDASQKLQRMNQFVNTYAKSGFLQLEPILREIAILSGLDPNVAIKAPEPAPPVEPNISLRLTGAEDMMNPLLLAFMLQSGQAPKPELIEQAKQLIQQAVVAPTPVAPPGADPMGMPQSPEGGLPPGAVPPPGSPADVPLPAPPAVGDANPNMTILPKITKRSDDPGAGGKS